MAIDSKYRTTATATGGRDGIVLTEDRTLNLKLATPKELGGPGGDGTNPEQLFAAGYSACFLSALKLVSLRQKIELPTEISVSVTVGIGPNGLGGFGLAVDLAAKLPGINREIAEQLISAAHQVCPYSNATRDNIDVKLALA